MSKYVRFDGRGRLLAFDYELWQGQSVEMTDEEAEQLASNPHNNVTVSDEPFEDEPGADAGEGQPVNNEQEEAS